MNAEGPGSTNSRAPRAVRASIGAGDGADGYGYGARRLAAAPTRSSVAVQATRTKRAPASP